MSSRQAYVAPLFKQVVRTILSNRTGSKRVGRHHHRHHGKLARRRLSTRCNRGNFILVPGSQEHLHQPSRAPNTGMGWGGLWGPISRQAAAFPKLIYSLHGERKEFLKKLNTSLHELYQRETVRLSGTKPDAKVKSKYACQEVTLDQVYVKLHILAKSELERRVGNAAAQGSISEMMRFAHVFSGNDKGKGATSIELGDLVELAAEERNRLLKKKGARTPVLAGACVGNTMSFLKTAGLEWSRGKIWNDMELAFALPLRQPSVHKSSKLEELLSLEDHGFHRRTDREEICQYINDNLSRVRLTLDGLDEVDLCVCSDFVTKVVKDIALDGVRLIDTSRPSIQVMELAKSHPLNQRVQVLGFSPEGLRSYVGKVLKSEDADALMRQVTGNPHGCGCTDAPSHW